MEVDSKYKYPSDEGLGLPKATATSDYLDGFGAPQILRDPLTPLKLDLKRIDSKVWDIKMLSQGGLVEIPGISDRKEFEKTIRSLRQIGLVKEEVEAVLKVISAIMSLSCVNLEADSRGYEMGGGRPGQAVISKGSQGHFAKLCDYLDLTPADTAWVLTKRSAPPSSANGGKNDQGQQIYQDLTLNGANDVKGSICRYLYSLVWTLLNQICCEALSSVLTSTAAAAGVPPVNPATLKSISLLDFMGLEPYRSNGFEQLCINFANEALHSHLVDTVALIESTRIRGTSEVAAGATGLGYDQTQGCSQVLSLFEGLFTVLDEETLKNQDEYAVNQNSKKAPQTSRADQAIVDRLTRAFGSGAHPRFVELAGTKEDTNSTGPSVTLPLDVFGISHYNSGYSNSAVCYKSGGFVSKNRSLSPDVGAVLAKTSCPFVRDLIRLDLTLNKTNSVRNTQCVMLRTQLNSLLASIRNSTSPTFVRCLNPNVKMIPDLFNRPAVMDQLRTSGIMDVVTIMRQSYSCRMEFFLFWADFRKLNPSTRTMRKDEILTGEKSSETMVTDLMLWISENVDEVKNTIQSLPPAREAASANDPKFALGVFIIEEFVELMFELGDLELQVNILHPLSCSSSC